MCSQPKKVSLVLPYCSQSESPSRSSVLRLYPGYLGILRITSTLFILFFGIEGSYRVLATLPFIQGIWENSIQWEWNNVGVTYKLLKGLEYSNLSLLTGSCLSPSHLLYREDLPNSRFNSTRHNFWSYRDAYHLRSWQIKRLGCLGSENTILARPGKNTSSPHHTSRSSRDTVYSNWSTIPLGARARWRFSGSLRDFTCAISVSVQH